MKQIILILLLVNCFVLTAFSQTKPVNKLPLIADMVHNNPGEEPYISKFNSPQVLTDMGYNSKTYFIFLSPQLAVNWDKVDADILPVGSDDRKWVDAKASEIHSKYSEMEKAGIDVYAMSDLILFPKRLIAKYGMEKTFSDPTNPQTQKYLRILIQEMFAQFPELDGIFVRIGETYLQDAPYHKGGIIDPYNSEQTIIPLMNILREEICEKLNKKLVFRTWYSFDVNAETYMKVSDAVEPHKNLTIAVKHCEGDFHRGNPFSKVLGIGRHKQLVEVQCAREYEGKGAYPNYIANGVINGFEEHAALRKVNKIASIKELADRSPLLKGMWTWSRGGGWNGPYIQNEFWPELNAYVMSQWAQNTNQSELEIFNRFAKEKLKLSAIDVKRFRKLVLLSQDAVIRGRSSARYFSKINPWWTRDQSIGIPKLPGGESLKVILAEKDTAVMMWKEIEKLSKQIKFADKATQSFIQVSAKYGLHLYEIYRAVFNLTAFKNNEVNAKDKAKWIKRYDESWSAYEKLFKENANCPTLYKKDVGAHMTAPMADDLVKSMRKTTTNTTNNKKNR
jgi:hypothetical protein